jgi:hypothetical protein
MPGESNNIRSDTLNSVRIVRCHGLNSTTLASSKSDVQLSIRSFQVIQVGSAHASRNYLSQLTWLLGYTPLYLYPASLVFSSSIELALLVTELQALVNLPG